MSSIAKQKSSSDFEPLPEGTHLGVCNAVIDVGLQRTPWEKDQEQVHLRFEVPSERIQYTKDGVEVDAPAIIWANYHKTLSKKATLRNHLETWRGLSEQELDGIDLFTLVGQPALLQVVHKVSKDRTSAIVAGIGKPIKGMTAPAMEMPPIRFSPEDTDQFKDLPEWLQKKFDARVEPPPKPEPKAKSEPTSEYGTDPRDFHDDDIPFKREAA